MYPCTKFQLIWINSDFEIKFAQKNMNDKNLRKINIKSEIKIQQCTSVPTFSQFGVLRFLGPNLPKKHFRVEYYKRSLRITYFK